MGKKTKKRTFNVKQDRPDLVISLNAKSMLYSIVDNFFVHSMDNEECAGAKRILESKIEGYNKLGWEDKVVLLNIVLKL